MIAALRRAAGRCLRASALAVSCAALVLVTLGVSPAAASTGDTFTATLQSAVSTFNPFLAYYVGETTVLADIYPTLTWGNEHNQAVAYLARSWNVSPDKLTWTFHLQKGLQWSDGTPLTAHDVAWTYDLIMHNTTAATANGSLVANFKSVTAPNDATVVISTKTPQSDMLSLVSTPPIVPEHIWAKHLKGLSSFTNTSTPVVGYGPFTMTAYKPNQYVKLTANKSFFLGAPKYHTVILDYFANSNAAVAALRSGAVDTTDDLTATEWHSLAHTSGIMAYQTEANAWEAVEVNAGARTRSGKPIGDGNPILHDPKVRRAIAMGIDRRVLVAKVLDGAGSPGSAYLPPAFPEWEWTPPASDAETYNPKAANALLTSAGYPMGKSGYRVDPKTGKELAFRLGIHSDYNSDTQIASYMTGWMKAIGVKLEVTAMGNTQLNNDLAVGNWDMLLDSWATTEDPTYLLSIQTCGVLPTDKSGSGGNTDSFFCNRTYDRLYRAEQSAFNPTQRAADIRQMEAILYNQNNDVILFYNNTLSAVRTPYAKGYVYGQKNAQGFYPLQNEVLGWVKAVPPAGTGGSGDTGLYAGVAVAVLVVLGGGAFALSRRRRTVAADRE